ncbi:MAG: N-acetylmuramoyl-L-alanine amidase [Caldisericia bacterium]|nr:N-acetylmuramoyl-L-alanine amidase [Caldisericia bacterium]MDD4614296.1 N-acetylmuramoyl-L-alanine amidase [Caldisericia bacterium]
MKPIVHKSIGSKMTRIFLVVLLCISQCPLHSNAESLRYALISPIVNVRNATSTKGDIVYVIESPGEYLILQESKDAQGEIWYKIQIKDDIHGFVANWVVDSIRTAEKETPIEGLIVVIEPGVKIRTRPSLHAAIHYITSEQEEKQVFASMNDENNRKWYKIQMEDQQYAWVASWVVQTKSDTPDQKSATDKLIICDSVNVRKGPSVDYPVVYYISSHLETRGIAEETDSNGKIWYKIRLPNNIEGWVASWVVKVQNWSDQKQQVTNKICAIEPPVNIRSGPSTTASIITTVDRYGEFEILYQSKDMNGKLWYEIRIDKGTGWVASWVVRVKSTGDTNETLQAVNVRSGPGSVYDKVFEIPSGTNFTIQGSMKSTNGDVWFQVLMGGKTGWIFYESVRVSQPPTLPEMYLNQIVQTKTLSSTPTLFEGPGEAYKQVQMESFPSSIQISAIAKNNQDQCWFQCSINGSIAWIQEKWLELPLEKDSEETPSFQLQHIEWSEHTDSVNFTMSFANKGLVSYESYQLQNPHRNIIEIKNCLLQFPDDSTKDEVVLMVQKQGILTAHIFQFSVHPNIVRMVVESTTDVRFITERNDQSLVFRFMDYANYAGPKLTINGIQLENQLVLKEYKGHLYAPLKDIAQTIRGTISWDNVNQQAILQVGNTVYGFKADNKNVYIKSGREDRIDIQNPILSFNSLLYVPISDCDTIFNAHFYALGNHYYLDNALTKVSFDQKFNASIFSFHFSFPISHTISKEENRITLHIPNSTLSSTLQPPPDSEWIKANSFARTVDNQSEATIVLSTADKSQVESAFISTDNRLIVTLKPTSGKGLQNKFIVIDPGHGSFRDNDYYDTGGIGPTGLLESAINLKISLKLKALLEENGAKVFLTRDKEQDSASPSLKSRIELANASGADMFISVHQNASINHKVKGIQCFYWHASSKTMAEKISDSISKETGLGILQILQRKFAITNAITSMPSILIETAAITNPEEEKMLQSDSFLSLIAEGLLKGIESYFQQ